MPASNPLDATRPEEAKIRRLCRRAFAIVRQVPAADIEAAIRSGSVKKITRTKPWTKGPHKGKTPLWGRWIKALGGIEPLAESVARKGLSYGSRRLAESIDARPLGAPFLAALLPVAARKAVLLDPEIAEEAANYARQHAGELVRGIDSRTRANLRRMVRNASRRLAKNPRSVVVAQLVEEIRGQIGLTSKQSTKIWRGANRRRRQLGWTPRQIADWRRGAIAAGIDSRAQSIASREVAESFNEGVLRAGRKARELERMPVEPLKRAETMRDARVRQIHNEVADVGAIPLEEDFPIFHAPRPPWPGEHG